MSFPHSRRTPSLPSTDSTLAPSQVHHQPSASTLANSSPLHITPDPSPSRSISNPSSLSRRITRSRKAGGFLLETPAGGDGAEREWYRERDGRGRGSTGFFGPELPLRLFREPTPEVEEAEDTDPARIVSLALASGATRKVETARRGVPQRSTSASRWLSGDFGGGQGGGDGNDRWLGVATQQPGASNGRDRAISPSRGFLITGSIDKRRSISTGSYGGAGGGNGGRRLSPLNPSFSPPPAPGLRHAYPSPSPSPLPTSAFPYQQLQKKRGLQEQQQLRELQRQYKFSEATLQRTLKAKQQLELSALYKRLLTIYPPTDTPTGSVGSAGGRVYNPLMSIRNKRIRNRERIQLDLSSWEDPGAVEQWIEDVAVAVHDAAAEGHTGPPALPPPPQPTGIIAKQKRPRLDWVISPQELLAEFYWIEEADRIRREEMLRNSERLEQVQKEERKKGKESQTSLQSLREKEGKKHHGSFEISRRKRSARHLVDDERPEELTKRGSGDSGKRRAKTKSGEFHRFLQPGTHREGSEDYQYSNPPSSEEESGRSSESEIDYDDEDYSDIDTSGAELDAKAKRKHHRRRRKLGQIITGAKHSKKKVKKKRSDAYALDADERRKRQEQEEMEWMAEMGGRMSEPLGTNRSYTPDEEGYDSAPLATAGAMRNGHALKLDGLKKIATGMSLPTTLGGSKSSLERYVMGRKSLDFAEVVVPSIAISLSPPRTKARDEGYDTDGRGRVKRKEEDAGKERKMSPTKKLFERSQEAFVRVREGSLDRRRESLDIGLAPSGTEKAKDKESKTKSRVKSRVEKIRNEVAKVEDFILRRDPGGSAAPSPTGSSFAESIGSRSDDDRGRLSRDLSRENTVSASEPEDEWRRGKTWGRSSLEVPDVRRPTRPTKYRSSQSMSFLPNTTSGVPLSPKSKSKAKAALLQDGGAVIDVDTDDDRRTPRGVYRLSPPSHEVSREPSPARSVIIQSIDKKRVQPNDHFRSVALEAVKTLSKGPAPPIVATEEEIVIIPVRNDKATRYPEDTPFATRRDLMIARAYLTRSGVVARGITTKRARETGVAGIVATAKEHMLSASAVSRDIYVAEQVFVRKANYFTDNTVSELRRKIDRIREDIEIVLTPMLASVADGADGLNEELTTTCTLAVKGINDEVAAMARRKRRQLRWVRRGGYVLLEWVVLGVMWWVWLVVVVLNIMRAVFRVGVGAVRWILWI